MKKGIALTLAAVLVAATSGCSAQSGKQEPPSIPSEQISSVISSDVPSDIISSEVSSDVQTKSEKEALLEKIIVKGEISSEKTVVTVENKTDKVFTGDIHVYLRDGKKSIYTDMVIVEDLKPGNQTYANLICDKANSDTTFDYEFSNSVEFSEDSTKNEEGSKKDDSMTKALSENFELNFSATSWSKNVSEIAVFGTENNFYAEIVVDTDDNESIKNITNAILFLDIDGKNLDKVIIKDKQGKTLNQKTR